MKIESTEFEHGRVYFKQFGAERVNIKYTTITNKLTMDTFEYENVSYVGAYTV